MGIDVMNGIAITLAAAACLFLFSRIGEQRRAGGDGDGRSGERKNGRDGA